MFKNLLKKDWAIHITITIISFFILLASSGTTMLVILLIRQIIPGLFTKLAPVSLTFIAFVSSTIIGTAVSLFVSRQFFKPVDGIIRSQKKVANGDFSVRVQPPRSETIITDLVEGFNTMTEELGSTEMFRNDFINNSHTNINITSTPLLIQALHLIKVNSRGIFCNLFHPLWRSLW